MSIRERLAKLCEIVVDEAERNSAFRRRFEEALGPQHTDLQVVRGDRVRDSKPRDGRPVADLARKRGRRTPAVLDPVGLARQGEEVVRKELSLLNLEQLKDVVAEYGMDPGKLVMKWKDPVRIVDRIVELSLARSTKGDAFRAEKPPSTDAPGE
jgi:hypothetical protein